MSVLIAVPTIEDGAAGRGAVEIADMLCAEGHRAIVVSGGGRLAQGLASGAAKMVRLDMASRNPAVIARNAFVLKDLILENRCTVVHALARGPAWSALLAARVTGTPFVTTWYNGFRDQNIFKRYYNGVMARGDRIVAASEQLAEAVAKRHPIRPERIVVIPSRVDVANFNPARVTSQRVNAARNEWGIEKDVRIILVVGRILRRKGHHVVVRAARRLKDMGLRDFAFVFVGEDDGHSGYSGELWDLVQATNTGDVIRIRRRPGRPAGRLRGGGGRGVVVHPTRGHAAEFAAGDGDGASGHRLRSRRRTRTGAGTAGRCGRPHDRPAHSKRAGR